MTAAVPTALLTKIKSAWIIDSGASKHMTHDRDLFTSYERITPIDIASANGITQAVGSGSVYLDITNLKGSTTRSQLTNVLYVLGLPINLVSATYLREKGTYFHTGHCTLHEAVTNKEIGYAPV
jgi:hypothetical protein